MNRAVLACGVYRRLAPNLFIEITVNGLTHIEPITGAGLGLPSRVVGGHLDFFAFGIDEVHAEVLFDRPGIAGIGPLKHHGTGHIGHSTAIAGRQQRQPIDRPMGHDIVCRNPWGRGRARGGGKASHHAEHKDGTTAGETTIGQDGDHQTRERARSWTPRTMATFNAFRKGWFRIFRDRGVRVTAGEPRRVTAGEPRHHRDAPGPGGRLSP